MQSTPNFNLPLYEGPDIANLLTGYNQAVTEIDTAMEANKQQSNQNSSAIQQHTGQLNKLNTEMETLQNEVSAADLPGMQSDINELKNKLESGKALTPHITTFSDVLIDYGNVMTFSTNNTYDTNSLYVNIKNYSKIINIFGNINTYNYLYYNPDKYWSGNIFNLNTNVVCCIGRTLTLNTAENNTPGTGVMGVAFDGSNTYIGFLTGSIISGAWLVTQQLTFSKEILTKSIVS